LMLRLIQVPPSPFSFQLSPTIIQAELSPSPVRPLSGPGVNRYPESSKT
jgi:hypothetical protein